MTPRELLAAGELSAAVAAQGALLRAKPTDLDARWFLFVLLCWAGELDRAILQLDMLTEQNAEFGMGSQVYRSLVTAEAERAAVLHREGNPLLPPDSGAHADARLAALHALRAGDRAKARAELERAESLRPALEGKLDGEAFDELFDTDELFGPILEVLAGGRYLWLPLERVRKLEIQPAEHQLELLWVPAQLEDTSGVVASVHLPALYQGSAGEADGRLRSGQMTGWREVDGVCIRGAGQKVLLARRGDLEREYALRDLRTLELTPPPSEAPRG
jgi:type VI secretion system protein ImpE